MAAAGMEVAAAGTEVANAGTDLSAAGEEVAAAGEDLSAAGEELANAGEEVARGTFDDVYVDKWVVLSGMIRDKGGKRYFNGKIWCVTTDRNGVESLKIIYRGINGDCFGKGVRHSPNVDEDLSGF